MVCLSNLVRHNLSVKVRKKIRRYCSVAECMPRIQEAPRPIPVPQGREDRKEGGRDREGGNGRREEGGRVREGGNGRDAERKEGRKESHWVTCK